MESSLEHVDFRPRCFFILIQIGRTGWLATSFRVNWLVSRTSVQRTRNVTDFCYYSLVTPVIQNVNGELIAYSDWNELVLPAKYTSSYCPTVSWLGPFFSSTSKDGHSLDIATQSPPFNWRRNGVHDNCHNCAKELASFPKTVVLHCSLDWYAISASRSYMYSTRFMNGKFYRTIQEPNRTAQPRNAYILKKEYEHICQR